MDDYAQTQCPEPGCIYGLPDGDPDAHGWGYFSELWWCPLHSYGEWHRLREHADEIAWYDGAIRKGEQWLKEETAERDQELTAAKRARRDRRHPDYPEYERRSAQRIARSEQRIETYTRQLADARGKRLAALAKNELEHANRRKLSAFNEESSEN